MHAAVKFACLADAAFSSPGLVYGGLGSLAAAGFLLTLGIVAGGTWVARRLNRRPAAIAGGCAFSAWGVTAFAVALLCGVGAFVEPAARELGAVAVVSGAIGVALLAGAVYITEYGSAAPVPQDDSGNAGTTPRSSD